MRRFVHARSVPWLGAEDLSPHTRCLRGRRVKLKAFHKFEDTAEAVQSATALVEARLLPLNASPASRAGRIPHSLLAVHCLARSTAVQTAPHQPPSAARAPHAAPSRCPITVARRALASYQARP